jgi:hypothetical protein
MCITKRLYFTLVITVIVVNSCTPGGHWGPPYPSVNPLRPLKAAAYFAPGQPEAIPTTLRIELKVLSSKLPVSQAALDVDGEGGAPAVEVELQQAGTEGLYSVFYFDYAWAEPDPTRWYVTASTAGGTYTATADISLQWLTAWK